MFILAYVQSLSFPIMSRFQMPTEPKNGLDLLRWLIFEPTLLRRFDKPLSKKEKLRWFLKACPYIIVLAAALYSFNLIVTVMFDLPLHFPQFYKPELIAEWPQYATDISQLIWLFFKTITEFGFKLIWGLIWGLGSGLVWGLGFGLNIGLGSELVWGLGSGLVSWFAWALGGGFVIGLVIERGSALFFGLALGLTIGFVWGLGSGLSFILTFYLMYFRLPFYPFHFAFGLFVYNFRQNPYLKDEVIYLPFFTLDERLIRLAYQQPEIAVEFANFLFEFRPLQQKLAAKILHAANAGRWIQKANELNADVFVTLSFPEEQKKFHPSERWNAKLKQLRTQLVTSQTHTQNSLKKEAFENFIELLKEFRAQTLLESLKWNPFYFNAIDRWLKVSAEYLETLKQQAQLFEPITSNIYKANDVLHIEFDQTLFVGRDDLKDALSFDILAAKQMPLFLIQGQRRAGKTSLLNFLPLLLGARFKIVPYDLQGLENRTLSGFFFALRNTINKAFGILEETAWNPPEDWLRAWGEFREYVAQLVNGKDFKLVLAFDEYEILHDDIFQRDPQQAARLLGAMRSFSQSQNQVVFLFVGARFFSDLQQPNWNEYFVQVKHLRVDYLKRPDVLHLIQRPTPDFGLVYADDLANRIFDLTQGHPALVQQICSEMVNLANMTNHRQMTHDDLDRVLAEKILFWESPAIVIFWTQFCAPAERATVKQILAGETLTDPVSRYRLELHGYIVKDGDAWKMRVPLFEQWLRKYIETFPV